jgi:hypothetical protein
MHLQTITKPQLTHLRVTGKEAPVVPLTGLRWVQESIYPKDLPDRSGCMNLTDYEFDRLLPRLMHEQTIGWVNVKPLIASIWITAGVREEGGKKTAIAESFYVRYVGNQTWKLPTFPAAFAFIEGLRLSEISLNK